MTDFVSKVAERLKLSQEQSRKLRSTAEVAGASSEREVEAVLAGIRKGEANVATANANLNHYVEYPQRVDECPVCYAHMHPVTLANKRPANFCPIHNVVMPSVE